MIRIKIVDFALFIQVIQRRWFVMIATEKTEIRTNLHVLISDNNKGFPSFIRGVVVN